MTDFNRLKEMISDSGMTITAIANKAGIERATFYNRLKGVGEFTASEIAGLAKALRMTSAVRDSVFFSRKVELNETQEDKMGGKTICIEADSFKGNAIIDSMQQPYGGGLEHVEDHKTGKLYTVIQKGDHWYAYEEREDGSLIWPPKGE